MVYDFVKKMRSELLNEKMELEYEHTKIKNELEQNQRFLEKIMQEEQETYDIFSPRRKNYKLKENIKSLKQKQDGLKKSDEEIRKKLLLLSQKVNDCEKAIKQKRQEKIWFWNRNSIKLRIWQRRIKRRCTKQIKTQLLIIQ